MKPTRMRAKALGLGARSRSGHDGDPQGGGPRKQRGIAKQKIETGCVLVVFCDRITNQYSILAD